MSFGTDNIDIYNINGKTMTRRDMTHEEEKRLKTLVKNTINIKDCDTEINQDYDIRYNELVTISYWKGSKDKEHSFIINLN